MKRAVIGLMTLLIVAMLVLPGCSLMGGDDTPATPPVTPATLPQLQAEVGALKSQIATLGGQIATLNSQIAALPTTPTDVSTLQSNLSILQGQVAELSSLIASLTTRLTVIESSGGGTSGGSGNYTPPAPDETTRWSVEVWADYSGYKLVAIDYDAPRIEEEDDYRVYILLENHNTKDPHFVNTIAPSPIPVVGKLWLNPTNHEYKISDGTAWVTPTMAEIFDPVVIDTLVLSFRPKAGDRVKVDSKNTYIDNIGKPYLDWETEISVRSDGTCRKVWAETIKKFTLPVPDGIEGVNSECPQPYEIRLEFELYYAS